MMPDPGFDIPWEYSNANLADRVGRIDYHSLAHLLGLEFRSFGESLAVQKQIVEALLAVKETGR